MTGHCVVHLSKPVGGKTWERGEHVSTTAAGVTINVPIGYGSKQRVFFPMHLVEKVEHE